MNDQGMPRDPSPPPLSGRHPPRPPALPRFPIVPALVAAVLLFLPVWFWFFCRIEPGPGRMAILIRKTGTDLPAGQVIALAEGQKGIQLEVLAEGRYFRNPYTWGWEVHPMTDIPAGRLGVVTRLYGADLPPGRILATEGTKGILPEVLGPGKYRVNPYAETVEQFAAINIRPGHVGVVVSLVGEDMLGAGLPEDQRDVFLVGEGAKGVQPGVLDPGTYYLNPYRVSVVEVNLQSQRFEMSGEDVISFLTMDGFVVTVEGTIEYNLERGKAALLTHRVGDMDDIIKKVILPRARGFSRIEGSKHPAIDFIVGETRQRFQKQLEEHLHVKCDDWGVSIQSVLVRKILVPDQIASISRDREVAVQDAAKYEQQIAQARSKAELGRQEMLAEQNKEKVQADTARIRAVIEAEQDLNVRVIAANRELEVNRLEDAAATFRVEAVLSEARGERDAVAARNAADAAVFAEQVRAFGGGMNFARYTLYQRVAPRIEWVLTGDGQDGLGSLFLPFLPGAKEVAP